MVVYVLVWLTVQNRFWELKPDLVKAEVQHAYKDAGECIKALSKLQATSPGSSEATGICKELKVE